MSRADDLAPLLAAPPAASVRFRQGEVVSWNPDTAENVIRVGGTDLADLPMLASSTEVLLIQPGDSVGIQVVGSGAASTMYILGRITQPGTPQAASVMEMFGLRADVVATVESTTSGTYTDLATVGPTVTDVRIGATGRCLVLIAAQIREVSTDWSRGGAMSFAVSGASTVAADSARRLQLGNSDDGIIVAGASSNNLYGRVATAELLEGLNPGLHTFTAKYLAMPAGVTVQFAHRSLIVLPY